MKQLITLSIVISLFLTACNASPKEKETESEGSKTEQKIKTIKLTKAELLKKVANYESNPNEWKYLGDKPAIIDFYADWCGPCKMIAPTLEELANKYGEEIYIYKVDVEAEKELAGAFGIQSLPSLLFIPVNSQPQMIVGLQPKPKLEELINTILLKK